MVAHIFEAIKAGLKADSSIISRVKAVYQFNINTGNGLKSWVVDLKNGSGNVTEGTGSGVDCNITMNEEDFVNLMEGKLNGQQAFMQGKLKIGGNMMLAMKLEEITKGLKLSQTAPASSGAGGAAAPSGVAGVFEQIQKNVQSDPSIVDKINGSYKFVIQSESGDSTWIVDLKKGSTPSVKQSAGDADCTLTIKESDFIAIMTGKTNPQSAFIEGKLKIKGSMELATKLSTLIQKQSKL